MGAGFAGIENPLYYMDKALMLFGDAKSFVGAIVRELGGAAMTPGRVPAAVRTLQSSPGGKPQAAEGRQSAKIQESG